MERLRRSSGQAHDVALSPGCNSITNESQTDNLFQQGLRHHQQNQLDLATSCYQQVLSQNPEHAGAWHFLGVIALSKKEYPAAIEFFEKSLALCTTKAVYYNNYAVALKETGRLHDALHALETALKLNPHYADAWSNIGQMQLSAKQHADAERL